VFDEITGLPVHPLAVHFAVALLVASVLLAFLFVVPHTRAWARLPLLLVSLGTVLFTYVARESGEALERVGGQGAQGLGGPVAELVNEHQEASNVLWWLVLGFAVVAVASFVLTRERTTGGTAHGVAAVQAAQRCVTRPTPSLIARTRRIMPHPVRRRPRSAAPAGRPRTVELAGNQQQAVLVEDVRLGRERRVRRVSPARPHRPRTGA